MKLFRSITVYISRNSFIKTFLSASSTTRTTHSYRQKQLNEAHQKQILKHNEKTIEYRFDHKSSALRDRTSHQFISFRFSTLAEFFIAKFDTNREYKRSLRAQTGLRVKNTKSADHIEGLKRAHIEGIR